MATGTPFNCAIVQLRRNCGSIKVTAFQLHIIKESVDCRSSLQPYAHTSYLITQRGPRNTAYVILRQCRAINLRRLFIFEDVKNWHFECPLSTLNIVMKMLQNPLYR